MSFHVAPTGLRAYGAVARRPAGTPSTLLVMFIAVASLTACSSERPPEMTGVRTVTLTGLLGLGPPPYDDVRSKNVTGAVLRGPHHTLGVAWTGISDELDRSAGYLRMPRVRAAEGEQLFLAAIDPELTYAPFDRTPETPVFVEVDVGGTSTKLDGLPLPTTPPGATATETRLIVIAARPDESLRLRVTDAGRTNSLDLRTGEPVGGSAGIYMQRQGDAWWSGESPAVVAANGLLQADTMRVGDAFVTTVRPLASLTTYQPARGYAAPGRAFLWVPAPILDFNPFLTAGLHVAFSDASVFTLRLPSGVAIPARPYNRDIDLLRSRISKPQPGVVFDVPADINSGIVVFDVARGRLTQETGAGASAGRQRLSWTRAPAAFKLSVVLKP